MLHEAASKQGSGLVLALFHCNFEEVSLSDCANDPGLYMSRFVKRYAGECGRKHSLRSQVGVGSSSLVQTCWVPDFGSVQNSTDCSSHLESMILDTKLQ